MTELSETQIQNKILRWAKGYPYKGRKLADYLVHVPNGEKRSKRVAAGLKHSGVKKGYPDLVMDIALNGYHGLRIELKTETGGVVSPEQNERLKMLNSEGYLAVVCKGFDEAIKTITDYMGVSR